MSRYIPRLPTFRCKNESGEVIPPFATMQVIDTDAEQNEIVINVDKPDAATVSAGDFTRVVFNTGLPIPIDGYGSCLLSYPLQAVIDGTVAVGDSVGPIDAEWYLSPASTASVFVVALDDPTHAYYESSTIRTWLIQPAPGKTRFFRFTLNEAWTSGVADADILQMDGTDTGIDADINDPLLIFAELTTGDAGICFLQDGQYWAVQAPCGAA